MEYIWRGHTAKCAIHKRKEADFFLPSRSTYYLRQRLWWEATCFPSLKKSLAIPGNCCMQILPCRGFMWFLYVCLLSEPGGLCWPQIPIMTAFQLTASMPMHRSQFKIFIYIYINKYIEIILGFRPAGSSTPVEEAPPPGPLWGTCLNTSRDSDMGRLHWDYLDMLTQGANVYRCYMVLKARARDKCAEDEWSDVGKNVQIKWWCSCVLLLIILMCVWPHAL